jgi:hypothetical protein
MPRVALPDSLQLYRIFGCLYTPYIQDQHRFTSFIVDFEDYRRPLHTMHPSRSYWYPRILDIIDLRPLQGRHTYKASLRPAPPDSLQPCWEIWVPLHFVRSRPRLSFLLFLSTKPAMLPASMLGDYSTSASSTPSCFPRRTDLSGNVFPITSLLNLLSFLLFWIIIPAILPTTYSDTTL